LYGSSIIDSDSMFIYFGL